MVYVWFVLAGALVAAESSATFTVVLSAIAAAAVLAGVVAVLDGPLLLQALAFAGSGTALTVAALPLGRRLRSQPSLPTGVAAMVGRTATVVVDVPLGGVGRAALGGETWSARPLDPTRELPAGRSVVVAEVDGATLVVYDPEDL